MRKALARGDSAEGKSSCKGQCHGQATGITFASRSSDRNNIHVAFGNVEMRATCWLSIGFDI